MIRLVFVFCLYAVALGPQFALAAPPVDALLPQSDWDDEEPLGDSALENEKTLEQLHDLEFSREAMSVKQAVTSSFIPGAGWGLLYAKKDAQSVVPFALSAVGYVLGSLFLGGVFSEDSTRICQHDRDGRVALDECFRGERAPDVSQPDIPNQTSQDSRDPNRLPYFQTQGAYQLQDVGKSIDGTKVGSIILIATYVVTTTIGAAWAGNTVGAYNNQLRRDIESTAKNQRSTISPIASVNRGGGQVGFLLEF